MGKASIFSYRDFEKLKEAERIIHDALPQMDKAENCGVECAEIRAAAKELQSRLAAIEREFMSPPPTR